MKKGPLNKKDKAYIKKYAGKVTVDAMAYHLERSFKIVEKFHSEVMTEIEQAKAHEELTKHASELDPQKPTALDMMGRNKRYGAVTMTEAASMAADDSGRQRKTQVSSRYKDCILIINKDRENDK